MVAGRGITYKMLPWFRIGLLQYFPRYIVGYIGYYIPFISHSPHHMTTVSHWNIPFILLLIYPIGMYYIYIYRLICIYHCTSIISHDITPFISTWRAKNVNPTSARADNSIEPVWWIVAVACKHLRKFRKIRVYDDFSHNFSFLYKPTWTLGWHCV